MWTTEPFRRREILFAAPLPLTEGSTLVGSFTPNLAAGYVGIELRFHDAGSYPLSQPMPEREAAAARLAQAVGGGWHGADGPVGLRIATRVHVEGRPPHAETTSERLVGSFGPAYVSVHLGSLRPHAEVEHRVEVDVERAVEALRDWDARLVVVSAGDWWNYATLEQTIRPVALGLALLLAASAWWVVRGLRRRRRPALGRAEPASHAHPSDA